MSADSAVTYTSVHAEAQTWSIPSEDPYEEAARQLLEQAPRSPEAYITEIASAPPPPPSFLPSLIRPPRTPLLLPIPLPAPSTSRRADIPEADTPPWKRLLLTTPRPSCEVEESFVVAAARQPGPTMAHRVDYSLVDTMETRFRDTERTMMTALEMVNMRVNYQVDVRSRESSEFYSRHHDAQKDRAAVRAKIEVLRRKRLAYEQESMETRQALARSEAYCRALEARVTVLETKVRRHEWQRQAADDFAVQHIMRTQALEAGARVDTLEDTASRRKWHQSATRSTRATTTPAPTATTTTTVTNAQLQAMIDQGVSAALAARDATRNGTDSHSSGMGGLMGVVEVNQWLKEWRLFPNKQCSVENQVKFHSACTLLESALTWWNCLWDCRTGSMGKHRSFKAKDHAKRAIERWPLNWHDKRVSNRRNDKAENKRKLKTLPTSNPDSTTTTK
ncbi:hypothetical protein Tco_0268308 [Tanacetum coccineum]